MVFLIVIKFTKARANIPLSGGEMEESVSHGRQT